VPRVSAPSPLALRSQRFSGSEKNRAVRSPLVGLARAPHSVELQFLQLLQVLKRVYKLLRLTQKKRPGKSSLVGMTELSRSRSKWVEDNHEALSAVLCFGVHLALATWVFPRFEITFNRALSLDQQAHR
jgi:hypothetical protein